MHRFESAVPDISYSTVMAVLNSWDRIKSAKNWQERAGQLIVQRMFELEPSFRRNFDFRPEDPSNTKAGKLRSMHARALCGMIDCTMAFLGPDLELLEIDMIQLGRRHVKYGVQVEQLPIMGQAVIHTLKELLGAKLSPRDEEAWKEIFDYIAFQMSKGMIARD